jgi:hypothetical protein
MVYIIIKNKSTRSHDFKTLSQAANYSSDPVARKVAKRNLNKISNESLQIKSMRESLVKAHREGNTNEIKDIHEYISKKGAYQNE